MRRWLAMLGFTWLMLVIPLPAQADDDEAVMLQARAEYRQGLELYDSRRYEDALEQFRASYKDFPSPNSLLYVARCLRSIGRTHEAIAAFENTIRAADARAKLESRYADTLQSARRELAVLKPPPPPEQRLVAATFTSGAISAAGLASFGIFWALARSQYRALENNCNPLPCPASQQGAVQAGRNYQLVSNVSLAVGVAGAATAMTLYVIGRPRTSAWGQIALVGTTLRISGAL